MQIDSVIGKKEQYNTSNNREVLLSALGNSHDFNPFIITNKNILETR